MDVCARVLMAICCSFWLLSCASRPVEVQSTIETHHQLGPADSGKRIIILPAQEEKVGTLEFAAYASFVEDGLRREGFQVVPVGERAELVAFFGYGIDQGRDELYSYTVPQFGQTGVQSSHTYSGTTTYTPSYGITGSATQVGTNRVYTRVIVLHIYDTSVSGEPTKLYESTVTSQGSSGTLGVVIDEVVASLFEDFRATGVRAASIPLKP